MTAIRTQLQPDEAIAVLATAYHTIFTRHPSPETLAILAAQSALETGQWAAMWGWNFGNIRGSYRGLTQTIKGADEIIDGKRVTGAEVEAGFRAYPNSHDGAVDYIEFLGVDTTPNNGRPNRYEKAFAAAERGDLVAFVRELKAAGYFTASESLYLQGVERLYKQLLPKCRQHLGVNMHGPDIAAAMAALNEAERAIERAREALKV